MLFLLVFWFTLAAIDPIFGIVIAALVGPIGAYLVAVRQMSGKIGSSQATDLWKESAAIRDWATARIDKCDEEILRLNTELAVARTRIEELERCNRKLQRELAAREDRYEQ